eukprot:3280760-Karenia_brevis.AAC.1
MVRRTVIGATKSFTDSLVAIGLEFSPTKNGCNASQVTLAKEVVDSLPQLSIRCQQRTKSLGGALGAGRVRNVAVQRSRMDAFKMRKPCFRKLRRAIGSRRADIVLRTGGTAGLTYGQANTGVACTTLLQQRRAVAAASVAHGAGNLDLTL